MEDSIGCRDRRGRFTKQSTPINVSSSLRFVENIEIEHNYDCGNHVCDLDETGCEICCPGIGRFVETMINSLGGPQRVNNVLTTLNLPSISHKNLKVMERRAGDMIEDFANMSMDRREREAFAAEIRDSNLAEDVTLIPPNLQNTQLISLGDQDADIHQIPNATPKPTVSKVEGLMNTSTSFIVIDLETTDLIRQNVIPHITQIAAVKHETGSQFSCYVVPKAPISSGAEDITRIVWDGTNLRLKRKVVAALQIFEALSNFFLWLQKFNNAVLIAHNGKKFDFRILSNAADKSKLFNLYLESCVGCIDSIAVMKSKFPKLPKYSQPYLAEHVCNKNYNAHNALDDVSMLNEILKEAKVSSVDLLKHTYSPGDHLLQEFATRKL
ncbi:unnamed protein product [Mytilus coruscus]|uniref:Exonuclease domain-containing protein n=1 Tax=Mytilus coruscus TaxID=42192 RepID=A0A6J8E9M1_MYTCO|nr:unnamed protein product [Mytilus coruscus]